MELHNILAEARAIHFAMEHNAIGYKEAKKRIVPMLKKLNKTGIRIAQKYGVKYQPITFQNLGENI